MGRKQPLSVCKQHILPSFHPPGVLLQGLAGRSYQSRVLGKQHEGLDSSLAGLGFQTDTTQADLGGREKLEQREPGTGRFPQGRAEEQPGSG
jgi:hypothetical protein